MRIYANAYELFSEAFRDMHEMSLIVKPKSYQNKVIEGQDDYITKEIQHYIYTLTGLPDVNNLFLFEEGKAHDWCHAEFAERIDPKAGNPGDAWKIREDVWEQFLFQGRMDYTYSDRINYQYNLDRIITRLQQDPDSRQAWLPIFHKEDVVKMGGRARIPCSLGYYFMIRDGKLNLTYIQRSADLVQHFGNDVYLAWLMLTYVASVVGVDRGYLTHHIFSLHSYKKDWSKLAIGISNLTSYEKTE